MSKRIGPFIVTGHFGGYQRFIIEDNIEGKRKALEAAERHERRLIRQYYRGRGARPTTRVWKEI